MVKSPLNRELVATYEVTLSVIDNASDLPEHSVSVPNGELPTLIGRSDLHWRWAVPDYTAEWAVAAYLLSRRQWLPVYIGGGQ